MERTLNTQQIGNSKDLRLEEKVARMCVVGAPGPQIDTEVEGRFQRYPFGGLGVFTHNIESEAKLKAWVKAVKDLGSSSNVPEPYYISIDEEGGSLSNFKSFFPYLPGNRSLGLTEDAAMAYQQGKLIGSQLHELGIPMNWAPVLDVNTNIDNPVVGIRSFGEDPHKVAELGASYIAGMHEAGVAVTAKHFPGHGEVSGDSHYMLPSCELTLEQILAGPVIPFTKAIQSNVDSIMVAHILFPNIPVSDGLPASLSPFFVTELLRNTMGFEGVICTDDIEMGAIKDNYEPRLIGELAVQAGNDLIVMCHTPVFQEEVIAGIVAAVKEGRIAESRIDESLERIEKLHEKMQEYQRAANPFPREAWPEKITEVARRTVVVHNDPASLLPLRQEANYLLILPRPERLTLADNSNDSEIKLGELLSAKGIRTTVLHISNNPDPNEILQVAEQATAFDTVIQGTLNAHIYQGQAELALKLSAQQPLIALILRNPYDADVLPDNASKVLLCSASSYSLQAFADLHTLKGGGQ
jgi:beta-glucosidase-like glycosyl hydrolase